MDKFKTLLDKKVAGVPVVLIVVLVMGGLLYGAVRMRPAPEEIEPLEEDGEPDGDTLEDTSVPVFSATPVIYQPSGGSVASTPQEDTNELWGRRSIEWLIANGETVNAAQQAIQGYLNGSTLSFDQGRIRDKAVGQFGLPPEPMEYGGTKGEGTYKGPFTAQGTPPLDHTVKGKSDDTANELSRGYYGSERFAARILSVNTTKGSGPWKPGTVIRVPEARRPRYYRATNATRTIYAIAKKNSTSVGAIEALNPGVKFPVKAGKRVRVQ